MNRDRAVAAERQLQIVADLGLRDGRHGVGTQIERVLGRGIDDDVLADVAPRCVPPHLVDDAVEDDLVAAARVDEILDIHVVGDLRAVRKRVIRGAVGGFVG